MTDTAETPITAAPSTGASSLTAPAGAVNPDAIPAPFSFARLFREPQAAPRGTGPSVNLNGPRLDLEPSIAALISRMVLLGQDATRQVEGLANRLGRDLNRGTLAAADALQLLERLMVMSRHADALRSAARLALRDLSTRRRPLGVLTIHVGADGVVTAFTPTEEGK